MIDCEAIEVNYIDIKFVKSIEAISMKNYFSRVVSIDEKKFASATYNSLYALNVSTKEKKHSKHIFRALSMKKK